MIPTTTPIKTMATQQKTPAPSGQPAGFHQQLQAAQDGTSAFPAAAERSASVPPVATGFPNTGSPRANGTMSSAAERYAGADIEYNGRKVSFSELPAEVQRQLVEQDQRAAEMDAYRARVAHDPNVGPAAKTRPYDPVFETAMMGLLMMDPSTAHMTPEEYYNYLGSDRAKYDTLIRAADVSSVGSPMADAERRIFGPDVEQESKVEMIRMFRAEGRELPKTFAGFERAWQSYLTRQASAEELAKKLLEL